MTPRRFQTARIIALVVDVIQLPQFLAVIGTAGVGEALVIVTDVIAAIACTHLVGWNWLFLPTAIAELVPGLHLAPTWTIAVLAATRRKTAQSVDVLTRQ